MQASSLRGSFSIVGVGILCFLLGILVRDLGQAPAKAGAFAKATTKASVLPEQYTVHARPMCNNDIREIYGTARLAEAITQRTGFHSTAMKAISTLASRPRISCENACKEFKCLYHICRHAKAYSNLTYGWERYDLLGPVVECPSIVSFGKGDDEKRFCFRREQLAQDLGCVAFSIGGKNQWGFEEELANKTKCHIHTFDCTVVGKVPPSLTSRVTFHKLCLGSPEQSTKDREFANFKQLVARAGVDHVTLLKMDIEGFEYEALQQIIDGNDQSLLPTQIALEFHYVTPFQGVFFYGRDLYPGEIYAFSNYLFTQGGYLVGSRRDNELCPHCTEVLLVKAVC